MYRRTNCLNFGKIHRIGTQLEEFDDPNDVLRQTRERFVAAFPGRSRSLAMLLDALVRFGDSGPFEAARRMAHQTRGVAGTLGFPTVSARAGDLEQLILAAPRDGFDRAATELALERLDAAFEADLLRPPPEWATDALGTARPHAAKILLVESDPALREAMTAALQAAGHRLVSLDRGNDAFDTARIERPDLVVIDVATPGADANVICRRLKTSVDLAATPVVFLSQEPVDDRRKALALGADEYLVKPVEGLDLVRRIGHLLDRVAVAAPPSSREERLLTYEAFIMAAQEWLGKSAGRLALVRLPIEGAAAAADTLIDGASPRDFVGRLNERHLLVLLKDADSQLAGGLASGEAASVAPGAFVENLIHQADNVLNGTESVGQPAVTAAERPGDKAAPGVVSVLLADDDAVIQMVARMALRRTQFAVTSVSNGRDALARAAELKPDLILLDWVMPEMDGLETCARLKADPATRDIPVIFLTGRSEASEVQRGLALGAIGYIAKPFDPLTLGDEVRALLKR